MKMTAEYVESMARLSCIRLTEEEKTAFAMELDMIMNYLDNLKNADTRGVEPTSFVEINKITLPDKGT